MSFDLDRLYGLLPAIDRIRDAEQGEPLRALLAVIAEQVAVLEEDLAQLEDDQFVETCADWVVPYLGDLLGVRALYGVAPGVASPRAEVANTISFRRRKGTAAMLQQLARDVTGWPARVVEFFELLGATQHLRHVRVSPPRGGTLNLRDHAACELIAAQRGAFDPTAHRADVRRIEPGRGRYNIPHVGLFLWRLQPYPLVGAAAREVAPGCYTFNPLGLDAPLFNQPPLDADDSRPARPDELPEPLRRRPLSDELEARRQALADGAPEPAGLSFGSRPVLRVTIDGREAPPAEVLIADLSDPPAPISDTWRRPPAAKTYQPRPTAANPAPAPVDLPLAVAVDPRLGRLSLPSGTTAEAVTVDYAYGFPADLGGGPYDRGGTLPARLEETVEWQIGVSQRLAPVEGEVVGTLAEAVAAWSAQPLGTLGLITIMDSGTYAEDLTGANRVVVPDGSQLTIVAADWPAVPGPDGGPPRRVRGRIAAVGLRPHLRGSLSVVGGGSGGARPSSLTLNGLLVEGNLTVLAGDLGALELVDTTVAPSSALTVNTSVTAGQRNERLQVSLTRAICGRIGLPESVERLRLVGSIVASGGADPDDDAPTVDAPSAELQVETSTVLGATSVRSVEASNCIFTGPLVAARRQVGCVRFSYLPSASRAPRRYHCLPAIAADEAEAARVRPVFSSRRYGDPDYCQLSRRAADELRHGADDGSEPGAYHDLFAPQRETNLRVRLEEYLRFGLEAGILYAT